MVPDETKRCFGPYHDGAQEVYADPLELYRELQKATGGRFRDILKEAKADDDHIAFPAIEALVLSTRAAFRMVPFDRTTGRGATERDCHEVLNSFLRFLSAEKKTQG